MFIYTHIHTHTHTHTHVYNTLHTRARVYECAGISHVRSLAVYHVTLAIDGA